MSDLVKKDLGTVSAYKYAKLHGYTGTEDEFARLMASYATVAEQASQSAQTASEKASEASQNATSASQSADTASASATSAQASATTATAKASEAQQGATTATTKAQEASQSASESSQSAQTAVQAKQDAESAKTASETAQGIAESARDDAESARDAAQQYAESINPEKLIGAYPVDTATGAIASFSDGADNIPMKKVTVRIEPKQAGSGDPSPDNVRPISGWDSVVVSHSGVNIWDEGYRLGFYNTNGAFVANTKGYLSSKNPIPVKPNSEYVLCIKGTLNQTFYISTYYRDGTFKSRLTSSLQNGIRTITIPEDVYFIGFSTETFYGTTYNHDISINYPSTDHDYHPYNGQSVSIPLPQTIYGGTLDVTNGVLTVDKAMIASYNGETLPSEWISDRDVYSAGATPTTGAQVVYNLATPITLTLTPTEIKSLLGDDNVWADTGDTEVEYRANTTLWVQKKITEAVAAALNS